MHANYMAFIFSVLIPAYCIHPAFRYKISNSFRIFLDLRINSGLSLNETTYYESPSAPIDRENKNLVVHMVHEVELLSKNFCAKLNKF